LDGNAGEAMHFGSGLIVDLETGEQRHTAVHHGLAPGDDDRIAAIGSHPMPLAAVVAFQRDALIFALVVPPDRQDRVIDGELIGAEQPRAPALQALVQTPEGGFVASGTPASGARVNCNRTCGTATAISLGRDRISPPARCRSAGTTCAPPNRPFLVKKPVTWNASLRRGTLPT